MTEKRYNQHRLEQQSRRFLRQVNVTPDPQYLYSLQYLQWVLSNHDLDGPWKDDQERLKSQVEQMFAWDQKKVQKILLADLEPQNDPLQFGMFLAENVHSRFVENRNPVLSRKP